MSTSILAETRSHLSDFSDIPLVREPIGTFVSLYSGAGGLDLGFALAGFAPLWVSEFDEFAAATHRHLFEQLRASRPHLRQFEHSFAAGDLLKVPVGDLPARGSADLVIGGPPCQGFSVAGKMDPNDERSKHVFHFLDIVDRVRPKAFLMENVKALFQNRKWAGIREALFEYAERAGYNTRMDLVNASHFGVPQARERMLFVGVRKDIGSPSPLVPTTFDNPPTVRDALRQLPDYGQPGNDSFCTARITTAKSPILRRSPFAGMLFNGAGRPLDLDSPSLTLAASMGGNKTPIIDQQQLANSQESSWVIDYHAELWSSNGQAIRTSVPSNLRRITVEEAAAIQTFPLDMKWVGPQSSKYRQIGNAVPPRLAYAAAEAIKSALYLS